MNEGPMFFDKNVIDLDLGTQVTITITDSVATDTGSTAVDYMRDRKNSDGWATTGSTDAANTQIDVNIGDMSEIGSILLVNHNFKAYTIQYKSGSNYVDFSTVIAETANADSVKFHQFTPVSTQYIRIIVTGAIVANADKYLSQLILTNMIGQLTDGWRVSEIQMDKDRVATKTLSGRVRVKRTQGAFKCRMSKSNVTNSYDMNVVETLFDYYDGFLVWIAANDTTRFMMDRIGWRMQDIYLMNIVTEYEPEWADGYYSRGMNAQFDLVESL